MGIQVPDLAQVVPSVDPEGRLEAVFVFRRSGKAVASWSRAPVSADVATVMGATLLGSVDTLAGVLGTPSPSEVSVVAGDLRIFVLKPEDSLVILLAGRDNVTDGDLADRAHRIAATFVRTPSPGRPASGWPVDAKP